MPRESTNVLVLNPDIEIVSIREFPPDIRERLGGSASDFVLSDCTSRIGSQRIDHQAAMFLRLFRQPRNLLEAVIAHSAEMKLDPAQVLNQIHPLVTTLRLNAVLVDPASTIRRQLGRTLVVGESFECWRIVGVVSHLAETDIYKALSADGTAVAIKYLRVGSDETVRANLRREVAALQRAEQRACAHTPRLLAFSLDRDDSFVCLGWVEGQTIFDMNRLNTQKTSQRHQAVAALLDAYDGLHTAGILHGDVHPCNVLVQTDGSVTLIDFGGARLLPDDLVGPRIGLVQFYEPEVARAVLAGQSPPAPTAAGEQYCVASLAYSLITGGSCLMLSLETETALTQIATQRPRPFDDFGVCWPQVESVLTRALSKTPADRFETFGTFGDSLRHALATLPAAGTRRDGARRRNPISKEAAAGRQFDAIVQSFTQRHGLATALSRDGLPRGPSASLYAGAGGIAYALLRVGCLRQEPAIVAAADVWIAQALRRRDEALAFTDGSVGAAAESGPWALFHSVTGLHVVHALISYISGNETETYQAVTAFIEALPADDVDTAVPTGLLHSFAQDATNGAPSLLLGAALLRRICGSGSAIQSRLAAVGDRLSAIVHRQFDPAAQCESRFLGYAHGRSGAIHALLRWSEACAATPQPQVANYLEQLSSRARRIGSGLAWPIGAADSQSPSWTGWCHGSAGHVLVWSLAARALQQPKYLELAVAAGRHIWELRGQSGPSLCCGAAGEALALYELARASGDAEWLDRGRELARLAVEHASFTHDAQGLFRSSVGIALAAAESLDPAASIWPLCQSPL